MSLGRAAADYARLGDAELSDLLIDLLIERAATDDRNIRQLSLSEALLVAPKLTSDQMDVLALLLLLARTLHLTIRDDNSFMKVMSTQVLPFGPKRRVHDEYVRHLVYLGCVYMQPLPTSLESRFANDFAGLFSEGFPRERIDEGEVPLPDSDLYAPCANRPEHLQVNAMNERELNRILQQHSISGSDADQVRILFRTGRYNPEQVREKCIRLVPELEVLFNSWSNLSSLELTNVGLTIAHSNVRRRFPEFGSLNIWFPNP